MSITDTTGDMIMAQNDDSTKPGTPLDALKGFDPDSLPEPLQEFGRNVQRIAEDVTETLRQEAGLAKKQAGELPGQATDAVSALRAGVEAATEAFREAQARRSGGTDA